MKILILGSTGFLGRHLKRALYQEGHEIWEASSKNCDLKSESSLNQFNSIDFDEIYHLAAWTQPGDFCSKHQAEQWIINQKINTNVLSFWSSRQKRATLIAMGSSCAYDPTLPLKEDFYLSGKPQDGYFAYAMTKRMLLSGLEACHRQFGLNYLYFIPSTLYGADYHVDPSRQKHFIFDLIDKIWRGYKYGDPVILFGNGEQKREVVYIDDFIKAIFALKTKKTNEHFNIGGKVEYTIKEFAKKICRIIGYAPEKIQFDVNQFVGSLSKNLSVEKCETLYPLIPTPLEEGLLKTIVWLKTIIKG
jgi:GDP-L-fucose synthase